MHSIQPFVTEFHRVGNFVRFDGTPEIVRQKCFVRSAVPAVPPEKCFEIPRSTERSAFRSKNIPTSDGCNFIARFLSHRPSRDSVQDDF